MRRRSTNCPSGPVYTCGKVFTLAFTLISCMKRMTRLGSVSVDDSGGALTVDIVVRQDDWPSFPADQSSVQVPAHEKSYINGFREKKGASHRSDMSQMSSAVTSRPSSRLTKGKQKQQPHINKATQNEVQIILERGPRQSLAVSLKCSAHSHAAVGPEGAQMHHHVPGRIGRDSLTGRSVSTHVCRGYLPMYSDVLALWETSHASKTGVRLRTLVPRGVAVALERGRALLVNFGPPANGLGRPGPIAVLRARRESR